MTSWMSWVSLTGPAILLLGGCGTTLANAPFSDGTIVHLEGYGTQSSVQLTCLSEDQINQLTGGSTPPSAPKASCYEVAVITAKSSQISDAITAYFQAQKTISSEVTTAIGAPPANVQNPVALAATTAIVSDVVTGKDAATKAAGLKATLSTQARTDVANALKSISTATTDPSKGAALSKAADAVQ